MRLGLELGPDVIRAVRLGRWGRNRLQTLELHWDPTEPAGAVAALQERLGQIGKLSLAVDLSFLFAKQLRLPPLAAAEKRRILTLEPERFFPVRAEELVLALRAEDNLVFAARASVLGTWLAAFETLAPIELVEPSPVSLARALGRADPTETTILMEEKEERVGVLEVGAGRVRQVRRIGSDPAELAAAVAATVEGARQVYIRPLNGNPGWHPTGGAGAASARELPSVAGVAPPYLAAYGAVLGLGGELDEALLPADLSRRITGRRRRSLLLGVVSCVLALGFSLFSLDGFRSRTERKLDAEIAQVRGPAEQVLALERQADTLTREARGAAAMGTGRLDPVAGLAALTRRLPPGAHLTALRSSGPEWQIDGYAPEAAPLVARLEEDPLFEQVRFLSATSRTRLNGRVYESFSITLRLVPAP
ncbi:MAG: PilN domain-containing protein [Gemmatimonadales bacterium]|nr:PilN domain-containing protein [Gemmatimonadales bacterium]